MSKSKLFLSEPHMSEKEITFINNVFNSYKRSSTESQVDAFEKEMAAYVGVKDAVAVHSRTSAIHLSLILLNVQKGDRVYCSTFTSMESINPILYLGAEPVWIDSESETWNMSPLALRRALHLDALKRTLPKAIIVAHAYGQIARMNELSRICDEYDIALIEDAADSLGSMYKGNASGAMGKFGIYSFSEGNTITAFGGGMLVSDDTSLMEKARYMVDHTRGIILEDEPMVLGLDYRMNDFLAGIGRSQLAELDLRIERKREIHRKYEEALADLPGIRLMPELSGTVSNRWFTILMIDEYLAGISAEQFINMLNRKQIDARPLRKPLHMHTHLKKHPYFSHKEMEHVAKKVFKTGISLPFSSSFTVAEQERVIETIRNTIKMVRRNREKIKKYEVIK